MVQQLAVRQNPDVSAIGGIETLNANADSLKLALRRLGGGVSIVTAGQGGQRTGATVTSATALSIDPPRMLVSINASSSTWPIVRQTGSFAINIPAHHQQHLAQNFAGIGGLAGADRYQGGEWIALETGTSILLGAAAAIDCEVEEAIERHSHVIVIGRVRAIRLGEGNSLLYQGGKFIQVS
jgi:flavin reductase (DIM6/NTAB) family NADH-FMN oxidoreductase RutF